MNCEAFVREYFVSRGYESIVERLRTPFSEIDLIVKNSQEILLIEVKSLSDEDWLEFRVTKRQRQRLTRALSFMQTKFSLPLRCHLVTVTKGGEIQVYEDFLS